MPKSLYVHIPFCSHICHYCDFSKLLYDEKWAISYIKELKKEILSFGIDRKLDTIYVGGGTPTVLNNELLNDLFSFLEKYIKDDGEFSVEGNPENITEEKLSILKNHKVNRLSIGIQSSNDEYLAFLGRKHTFEESKRAISLAKREGFNNISSDLIYAFPNETIEDVKKDIDALLSLDIDHLSTYSLTVSKGTSFYNRGYKEADDELSAKMYELILSSFREKGYERYEVSNFARNNKYSRHNLTYWHDEEYYGAGLGASGYVNNIRYTNTRSLKEYLEGKYVKEKEILTENSQLEDYFLTNLRLASGFKKSDFEKRFSFSFESKYKNQFDKLHKEGLLDDNGISIYPTDKGILLLDRILIELF